MAGIDNGPPRDRPELRAPDGGKDLHYDRLVFLGKIRQRRQLVLRELYERALSDAQREADLASWSETWNLADPWIVHTAARTYDFYSRPGTHQKRRQQAVRIYRLNGPVRTRGDLPDGWGGLPFDPDDLTAPYEKLSWIGGLVFYELHVPETKGELEEELQRSPPFPAPGEPPGRAYDPTVESWSDFLEGHREALEEHRRERERAARERGANDRTEKRARLSDDPALHFAWLARWQIPTEKHPDGERYEDIRRNPGPGIDPLKSTKAIGRHVREVAGRIGLTRRTEL